MEVSINKALAMDKALRSRLAQLNELKNEVSKRKKWYEAAIEKTEEPVYDVKLVDKKIVKINQALFEINHKIKEINAKTNFALEIDFNDLVSEIA